MPREAPTKHLVTSKGAHFVAKKSIPQPNEVNQSTRHEDLGGKKYTNYLAFVDDPKSRTPFTVLPASKIQNYKDKSEIDNSYLNKSRRKRQYDLAFTTIFKHTCRIFAKCEDFVKVTVLHEIVQSLNSSYYALMVCKVPVEQAYETLMESKAKEVKAGVDYDTGKVINKRARVGQPPDTASSYSEMEEPREAGENHVEAPDDLERTHASADDNRISSDDDKSDISDDGDKDKPEGYKQAQSPTTGQNEVSGNENG